MNTIHSRLALLLGAALFCAPVCISGLQDDNAKRDARNAGHEAKGAAKDAGNSAKNGTDKAYHSTKNGGEKAYNKTRNGTEHAYGKSKNDTEKGWHEARNTGKGVYNGGKEGAKEHSDDSSRPPDNPDQH